MQKSGLLLLIILLCMPLAHAVELTGFVNDQAGVLTVAQKQELTSLLQQSYDAGKAQIAVVIVQSLEGKDINSYALKIAQGNLGEKEKNDGLLLLIAINERQYRFEVGRGLEPIFNDAKVGRMGRELLVPAFQQNDYFTGIKDSILAINAELKINGAVAPKQYTQKQSNPLEGWLSLFLIFIVINIIINSIRKTGRGDDNVFLAALVASSLLRPPRGGFGGGLGGGGFGGFGGGGFGGGGAGGGW